MTTQPEDPSYRVERLRGALVGIEHRAQYATSTTFHHAIDTLSSWLPGWVQALAAQAAVVDAEEARRLEEMKRAPFGTMILSPEAAAQLVAGHTIPDDMIDRARAAASRELAAAGRTFDAAAEATSALWDVVDPDPHDNPVCRRRVQGARPGVRVPLTGACEHCLCRCHVMPHPWGEDAAQLDRCSTCEGRFPFDHEIHTHPWTVDTERVPCCQLPPDHPTHAGEVAEHGFINDGATPMCAIPLCRRPLSDEVHHEARQPHYYERGPDDLCNRTACRRPADDPTHHRYNCGHASCSGHASQLEPSCYPGARMGDLRPHTYEHRDGRPGGSECRR